MLKRLRDDIFSAFVLLSRLPMPKVTLFRANCAWAWPWVGAALSALALAPLWVIGTPPQIAAGLYLALMAIMTGGLHEDGLADTADGLFGGHTAERRLEIMKDSRIGSYGMLALLLMTLIKWSALTSLFAAQNITAIAVAAAVSRAPMAVLMGVMPNARRSGTSHSLGRPAVWSWASAAAACLAALILTDKNPAVTLCVLLGLIATIYWVAMNRIHGQTGDILGASQQINEAALLVCAASQI